MAAAIATVSVLGVSIIALFTRVDVAVSAVMSRGFALTMIITFTMGSAGAGGALIGEMAGIAASVVIVAILAFFHDTIAALRGIFRNDYQALLPVGMMIVGTLIAEDFFYQVTGGFDGHVLEVHVVILEVKKACVGPDAPFVDGDGRAGSIDHQTIGVHEGEGALKADVVGFAR
jgi:hypothetical protein